MDDDVKMNKYECRGTMLYIDAQTKEEAALRYLEVIHEDEIECDCITKDEND